MEESTCYALQEPRYSTEENANFSKELREV